MKIKIKRKKKIYSGNNNKMKEIKQWRPNLSLGKLIIAYPPDISQILKKIINYQNNNLLCNIVTVLEYTILAMNAAR